MNATAVILAGGRGTRMKPYAGAKCLAQVGGKSLLRRLMESLDPHVDGFVVCVGYESEAVAAEAFKVSARTRISNLGSEAGMLDRVAGARFLSPGRLLVCYGDTLADVDVSALVSQHERMGLAATLAVAQARCPFGIVSDREFLVTAFEEKPEHMANIGFALVEPSAPLWYGGCCDGANMDHLFRHLAEQRELGAYRHEGWFGTVNTMKDLAELEEEIG